MLTSILQIFLVIGSIANSPDSNRDPSFDPKFYQDCGVDIIDGIAFPAGTHEGLEKLAVLSACQEERAQLLLEVEKSDHSDCNIEDSEKLMSKTLNCSTQSSLEPGLFGCLFKGKRMKTDFGDRCVKCSGTCWFGSCKPRLKINIENLTYATCACR